MYIYILGGDCWIERVKPWLASCGVDRESHAGKLEGPNARRPRNLYVFFFLRLVCRSRSATRVPKTTKHRVKNDQNRAKIVRKSVPERPGAFWSDLEAMESHSGRHRNASWLPNRPSWAPSWPSWAPCWPAAAPSGEPRSPRKAPSTHPRRSGRTFASPNGHEDFRAPIFERFRPVARSFQHSAHVRFT